MANFAKIVGGSHHQIVSGSYGFCPSFAHNGTSSAPVHLYFQAELFLKKSRM